MGDGKNWEGVAGGEFCARIEAEVRQQWLENRQVHRNEMSRLRWDCFGAHRRRVLEVLGQAAMASAGRALAVLGAGNCNDLDLRELLGFFSQRIDLVDLDRCALNGAVQRQGVADEPRIRRYGGVDVSGIGATISRWRPDRPPDERSLEQCFERASWASLPLPAGSCDVAVSACLLSQLIDALTVTLGLGHPRFLELMQVVRRRHLQQLLDLVRPGAIAVWFLDIVSSATYPPLGETPQGLLAATVARLIQQRNFFTGMNPFVIRSLLERDAGLAARVERLVLTRPWLWNLGPRHYAVTALLAWRSRN